MIPGVLLSRIPETHLQEAEVRDAFLASLDRAYEATVAEVVGERGVVESRGAGTYRGTLQGKPFQVVMPRYSWVSPWNDVRAEGYHALTWWGDGQSSLLGARLTTLNYSLILGTYRRLAEDYPWLKRCLPEVMGSEHPW